MLRAEFVMIWADEEDFISSVDLRSFCICFWSPRGRALLEERKVAQLVKISAACIGSDVLLSNSKDPTAGLYMNQINPAHNLISSFFKTRSSIRLGLQNCLFP
jgi:hypothetical protein